MNALPLVLALLVTAAPAPSGRALNTEGFRLYQAGRYHEALKKFRAASQADPKLALAHYNVAATLGVLRKRGLACEEEAYRETIVQYLLRAVELDPRRLARAQADADLDVIRDTLGWQRLLGRSPEREADVPVLLQKVTWSSLTAGALDSRRTLTFPDARHVVLRLEGLEQEGERDVRRQREEHGTYTLQGRTVTLTFPQQGRVEGTLTERGALQLGTLGTFVDNPPECDA
jgi:tetratricopeptide (TPR) repeat protein